MVYIYIYVHIYICTYIYMVYIYIYVHIYIYIYTPNDQARNYLLYNNMSGIHILSPLILIFVIFL